MVADEELRKKAQQRADDKISFFIHFSIYLSINLMLAALWWINMDTEPAPWFLFPLIGWGIGIAIHFVGTFIAPGLSDSLADKEYKKLREKER